MSTLEELGLKDDESTIEIPEDIPEEGGGYVPIPQPGVYVLKLPDDLNTIWGKLETTKGPRISAWFSRENPLTVVDDTTFDGYFKGSPLSVFINNREYPRGRERVEVADMFYLIQALEANVPDADKSKLTNNTSFVKALQKHPGKLFKATVHWEAYCNPKRPIRITVVDDEGNRRSEEQEGTFGCGAGYTSYSRELLEAIPKDENNWYRSSFDEIEVHGDEAGCPAHLFCNARLGRFAPFVR